MFLVLIVIEKNYFVNAFSKSIKNKLYLSLWCSGSFHTNIGNHDNIHSYQTPVFNRTSTQKNYLRAQFARR